MRPRHVVGIGLAAGCLAGLVVIEGVHADGDDSPREQHRSVVLGLETGGTAAVDVVAGTDLVRVETVVSHPASSTPGRGPSETRSRAVTPGGGPQSKVARPSTTRCPGQNCETRADGSVHIIPSGGIAGFTFYTGAPSHPVSNWTRVEPTQGIDTGAVSRSLVQEVRLPDISLRTNPLQGVVAVPTWFWAEGYRGETLGDSRTVSADHNECRTMETPDPDGGPPSRWRDCHTVTETTTVIVRVEPTDYQWSFGDGAGHEARGPDGLGTPFLGVAWPSSVQHMYEYSSFGLPDGFPIRLTVTFAASFQVNGGPWQGLGDLSRTYAGSHVVRQIEPLRVALESIPATAAP